MHTHSDCTQILLDEQTIAKKVEELANRISKDYANKEVTLVCILKGAFMFFADLIRQIDLAVTVDFMSVSSYGDNYVSSGSIKVKKDLDYPIEGKHVLLVEDIIDSGITLKNLTILLESRKPASLRTVCLVDKKANRQCDMVCDYSGFEVPNEFIVGYGLDYAGRYRNLPFIGVLDPKIYKS